jgi:hypothetical protein
LYTLQSKYLDRTADGRDCSGHWLGLNPRLDRVHHQDGHYDAETIGDGGARSGRLPCRCRG